jgi:hypothetical protein
LVSCLWECLVIFAIHIANLWRVVVWSVDISQTFFSESHSTTLNAFRTTGICQICFYHRKTIFSFINKLLTGHLWQMLCWEAHISYLEPDKQNKLPTFLINETLQKEISSEFFFNYLTYGWLTYPHTKKLQFFITKHMLCAPMYMSIPRFKFSHLLIKLCMVRYIHT